MRRLLFVLLLMAAPLGAQEVPMTEAPPPLGAPLLPSNPGLPSNPSLPSGPGFAAKPGWVVPTPDASPVAASSKASGAETDLTAIVLRAHPIVQAVMAGLAAMGFVVLTVLVYKSVEITRAQRGLRASLALVTHSRSLAGLGPQMPRQPEAGAAIVRLVEAELADLPPSFGAIEAEGLRERCKIGLARVEATALQSLGSGVGTLAQVAATAPFIGLFGTVFGIMNAFLAIASTKTTSLSVVAPGIAEALMATALGLGAAIPAVLVYNLLTRRIALYRHRLGDVAAVTERLLSREIVRRMTAAQVR
jgi:biopolymer transport protein ExbB